MAKRRKALWILGVLMVAVIVTVALTLHAMGRSDAEHARFYNAGKTINDFLKSYCKGLEKAHAEGRPGPVVGLYGDEYLVPARGRWSWSDEQSLGDVAALHLVPVGDEDIGRSELAAEVVDYLAGLTAIDQTICKIDLIEEIEPERWAVLTVKFILDGVDRDGRLFQDRMFYRWHLVNQAGPEEAYAWKIIRDELVEGIRVAGDAQGLVDVDPKSLGIDFEHQRDPKLHMKDKRDELQFGVIQHASGGLSAADYDLDGHPDLFFLGGRECRLYRNQGFDDDVTGFADVTAEAGLEGIDQAHVALFADFDNDGDRDLFVGRYLAPSRYFRNDGDGTFSDASAELGIDQLVEPIASATLLDYDRDGYVDLYLGINGNAFEAFPRLPFYAQNGEPNRLLRNADGKSFVDVTAESGTGDVGWSLAVAAGDYDGDGYPDLAVANDFGRKNLYRNNGDGTFTETAKEAGVLDFSGGMGLAWGDFDDDGSADLYTSNINSNQRWFGEDMTVSQYTRNVLRSRWMLADFGEYWDLYKLIGTDWIELGQQIGEGNSLFRNRGDGTFEELKDSHTGRAGWGWSVAFFDLENDGDQDLYAANGWVSNTPGTDL